VGAVALHNAQRGMFLCGDGLWGGTVCAAQSSGWLFLSREKEASGGLATSALWWEDCLVSTAPVRERSPPSWGRRPPCCGLCRKAREIEEAFFAEREVLPCAGGKLLGGFFSIGGLGRTSIFLKAGGFWGFLLGVGHPVIPHMFLGITFPGFWELVC